MNQVAGSIRFNTDSSKLEIYNGNQWWEIDATSPDLRTGGTRGFFISGGVGSKIEFINIATAGNAGDFGDVHYSTSNLDGSSDRTRAVFSGGYGNEISKLQIETQGNSSDFGDLTAGRGNIHCAADRTRGLFMGGYSPSNPGGMNNIDYVTIQSEGNAIDLVADGEITMEANWISKFLGSGELSFVNMFSLDIMPKISGVFQMVKGSIVDACVDQPGIPPAMPPLHIRISNATTLVGGMADVVSGTTGAHFTFVNTASGGIAEIVNAAGGAIINQVNNGIASYGVNTGFFAAGCSAGPTQIYGLPVLLN